MIEIQNSIDYGCDLNEKSIDNINNSFHKIFHAQQSGVKQSEKQINDYLDKRKELLMNRMANKMVERKSKISHMLKPIIDMNDDQQQYGKSPPHKTSLPGKR